MKNILFLFCLLSFFQLTGCSTGEETGDNEFANEVASEESSGGTEADTEETDDLSEKEAEDLAETEEVETEELDADLGEEEVTKDEFAGEEEMPEDIKQKTADEQAPPTTPEPVVDSSYENQAVITGVDFRSNENGGTIVIQSNTPIEYQTKDNQKNSQFVINLKNVQLPSRFKKPYNTKEFSGPIGMFQGYQETGSSDAKFVIQLKNATPMSVIQEGNSLLVMMGSSDLAKISEPVLMKEAVDSSGNPVPVATTSGEEPEGSQEEKALTSKNMDEFLTGDAKYYGRKIDIEVKNANIRDVLDMITEHSGMNLIISDTVKGNVNLKLRRIPWDQALIIILQSNNLGYVRQGNILRIASLAEIRQENDEAKRLADSQKQLEPLKVKIFNVSYASASEISTQVQGFLSARGKAVVDQRTNSLVITDINEVLQKVEKLIKRLDTETPQVLIEAKIVEMRESFTQSLGVNWSANNAGISGAITHQQDLVTGTVTKSGALGIAASLTLLENDSIAKVLSSPRVVTLNNKRAQINQSEQIPLTQTTCSTTGCSTTTTYKTVNLSLGVTPQITAQGGVVMQLDVTREFAGANESNNDKPIFSRNASSNVLVQSGDTTVIGGIYQNDTTQGNAGLPFLRRIPLIGYLFGVTDVTETKNELLIFVTPRILNRDKAFSDYLDESNSKSKGKEI